MAKKNRYLVDINWTMYSSVYVTAETGAEAEDLALEEDFMDNGEYVDGSSSVEDWDISEEDICIDGDSDEECECENCEEDDGDEDDEVVEVKQKTPECKCSQCVEAREIAELDKIKNMTFADRNKESLNEVRLAADEAEKSMT